MKQGLGIVGVLILAVLVIFFVGTKPAPKEGEEKMDSTSVTVGKQWEKAPEMTVDSAKNYSATIETSKGTMKVELFSKDAPKTVNNFIFLAREKFYDGVPFHRIMKGFMVQTGDPTGTGTGGPGYRFEDEKVTRDYKRGTVAMANAGPDTNGSQFFIIDKDNTTLPKDYTIFGMLNPSDTESLKTLDAIAATPVELSAQGEPSMPKEKVTIKTVTIEEK